jgi:hypothetical protein
MQRVAGAGLRTYHNVLCRFRGFHAFAASLDAEDGSCRDPYLCLEDTVAIIVDQLPASPGQVEHPLPSRHASAQRHVDEVCKGVRTHLFHDSSSLSG